MDTTETTMAAAVHRHSLDLLLASDLTSWLDLWHQDGVYESPFTPEGSPQQLVGKQAIDAHVRTNHNAVILRRLTRYIVHETPDPRVIIAESLIEGKAAETGRPYCMPNISLVHVESGLITYWRSYWNPLVTMETFAGSAMPLLLPTNEHQDETKTSGMQRDIIIV